MATTQLDADHKKYLADNIVSQIFRSEIEALFSKLQNIALTNSAYFKKRSLCFMYKNTIYPAKSKGEKPYILHDELVPSTLEYIDVFDHAKKAINYIRFVLRKVAVNANNYADYIALLPEYLHQFMPAELKMLITTYKVDISKELTEEKIEAFRKKMEPHVNKYKEYLVAKAFTLGR